MLRTGDEGPDMNFQAGVSLELGFEGKLWFEPMLVFNMPGFDYDEKVKTL